MAHPQDVLFRSLADIAPVGIYQTDAVGHCVYVNRAYEFITGFASAQCMGDGWVQVLHPEDRDRIAREWYAAANAGLPFDTEARYRRPSGETRWVHIRATRFSNIEGVPAGFIGAVTDLTLSRTLADGRLLAPEGAWTVEWPSGAVDISRNLRRMRQLPDDQTFSHVSDWGALVHPEDLPNVSAAFMSVIEGAADSYTMRLRVLVQGRWRWVEESGQVVARAADGSPTRLAGTQRDVDEDERRLALRAMQDEQMLRLQKTEALSRMAGGLAHDFNNLLAVISAAADLMDGEPSLPASLRGEVAAVREATRRAVSLTDRLLAISRRKPAESTVFDASEALARTLERFGRTIRPTVVLDVQISGTGSWVRSDPEQLSDVIIGVMQNAVEAMPDGGTLRVRHDLVTLSEPALHPHGAIGAGEWVRTTIEDTGIGMPPETLSRVFEPFFSTKALGAGLGLASALGVMASYGGHVRAHSAVGHGTTMELWLPREAQPAVTIPVAAPPPVAPPVDDAALTVLLVDDDAPVRASLARLLRRTGRIVLEAENAGEALELLAAPPHPVAALVTDIVMPGMDGRELGRRVRQTMPDLPIVYVSGFVADAVPSLGALDTRERFLAKPFPLAELDEALRTLGIPGTR